MSQSVILLCFSVHFYLYIMFVCILCTLFYVLPFGVIYDDYYYRYRHLHRYYLGNDKTTRNVHKQLFMTEAEWCWL